MQNFKLKCINNELVVIDISTGKPIGYLTYDRSFINATLELKATIMDRVPISAHEKKKQYEKDYYQPPQVSRLPKGLQLPPEKGKQSESKQLVTPNKGINCTNNLQSDSLPSKKYNSNAQSESKPEAVNKVKLNKICALSKLISEVTAIQNTPTAKSKEVKPMLVRLSPQTSNSSSTLITGQHCSCPCCNSTGAFIQGRISRSCFRCGGKGYMDDTDNTRYDAYQVSRGYTDKTTYRDHNNSYTIR